MRNLRIRSLGRWFSALGLALLAACGPPRVEETLRCSLASDGTSEVILTVDLPARPEGDEVAPIERHERAREAFAGGWDPWTRRFEALRTSSDSVLFERRQGELRRVVRTARFETPSDLAELFAGTDLTLRFEPGAEQSSFAVYAGSSSRATKTQREQVAKMLGRWSEAAVDYLREVASFYAWLEENPDRAEAAFTAIFGDPPDGFLPPAEEERLERLVDSYVAVMDLADEQEDGGPPFGELLGLAYDPYPARFEVTLDGDVTSVLGFEEGADGVFQVPELDLILRLSTLEEVWIEPPLLTTYFQVERLPEGSDFDIVGFARRPRRVETLPSASEVRRLLVELLEPEPEVRLVWTPVGS